jgi:transcriptional regulator with XRE-family HTH domain
MGARKGQQSGGWTKLARARIASGLTQQELADKVGISLRTIKRLENDWLFEPRLNWFLRLSLALEVPLVDLIEDHDLDGSGIGFRADPGWIERTIQQRNADPDNS